MHQDLADLITRTKADTISFQEVISTIRRHYECTPCSFRTGAGTPREVHNPAGTNAASCLLLAFAGRLNLDRKTTLHLYGEHYRSVLDDPDGSAHGNIRAFMANGWEGVRIDGDPLRLRGPG